MEVFRVKKTEQETAKCDDEKDWEQSKLWQTDRRVWESEECLVIKPAIVSSEPGAQLTKWALGMWQPGWDGRVGQAARLRQSSVGEARASAAQQSWKHSLPDVSPWASETQQQLNNTATNYSNCCYFFQLNINSEMLTLYFSCMWAPFAGTGYGIFSFWSSLSRERP